jgi:PAS domain S-box-containing protein
MVGLGMDTTDLRSHRERAGRSMERATDGLAIIDPDWTINYVNPAAARILGRDRDTLEGCGLWATFPEAVGSPLWDRLQEAKTTLEPVRFRARIGPDRWFDVHAAPAPDGLTVYFRDVDAEVRAEQEREELVAALGSAIERAHHLQEITARLADSRTVGDVARAVLVSTRRALDTLHAGISLVDDTGRFLDFQDTDQLPDPTRAEWARVPLSVDVPITIASRTGQMFFHESSEALLADFPHLRDTMALVGQGAFANVPLVSGGRPFGVLAVSWPSARQFSEEDRDFLITIAGQCAQAIERARVFEREHATAEALQRAIVPSLGTSFDDVRCTGRYLPAEANIEVGGDWYDAFLLPDGSLAIVIGDVAGHGLRAATTMTQLRNMLRAYAFDEASPASVLARMDSILADTGSEQFATCFYARFDPGTRELSFANAGHLPPILLEPHRPAALLPSRPSPLLGARGEPVEETMWIEPGTKMLLFTDGLIERRSRPIDDGITAVLASLRTGAPSDLDMLCDHVLGHAADQQREDDVCLLAVDFGGVPGVGRRRRRFKARRRRLRP